MFLKLFLSIPVLWGICILGCFGSGRTQKGEKQQEQGFTNPKILNYLGTKARYSHRQLIAPNDTYCSSREAVNEEQSCENVTFIYQLVRHGTRYPTKDSLKRMKAIPDGEIQKIVAELFPFHSHLTHYGQTELYELGKRIAAKYPHLFRKGYHPDSFDFASSQVPRALQSGHAYSMGLFEGKGHLGASRTASVAIRSERKERDTLLRFHKACPGYKSKIDAFLNSEYSNPLQTQEDILLGAVQRSMKSTHLDKLPFLGNTSWNEVKEYIKSLWEVCKFEIAVHNSDNRSSCQYFEENDLAIMEFLEDSKIFWLKSYGFKINSDMSCNLSVEILHLIENNSELKAAIRFAHAETLIPLATKLGLFHQEGIKKVYSGIPKLSSHEVSKRSWRSGRISPFGANILFEVHTCASKDPQASKRMVRAYVNEQPVRLCDSPSFLCDLEEIRRRLGPEKCNFQEVCKVPHEYQ